MVLYSGPPGGLEKIEASQTRRHLFGNLKPTKRVPRSPKGWLRLEQITRNNLSHLDVDFPLGTLITVTGVSGSGKSSLVSQALVELVGEHLGQDVSPDEEETDTLDPSDPVVKTAGRITAGMDAIKRLVRVDQKPIGRTPRSNLATYTAYSITFADYSPKRKRPSSGITRQAAFRSMWRKDDARPVRARDGFAWNCCLCRAFTAVRHLPRSSLQCKNAGNPVSG